MAGAHNTHSFPSYQKRIELGSAVAVVHICSTCEHTPCTCIKPSLSTANMRHQHTQYTSTHGYVHKQMHMHATRWYAAHALKHSQTCLHPGLMQCKHNMCALFLCVCKGVQACIKCKQWLIRETFRSRRKERMQCEEVTCNYCGSLGQGKFSKHTCRNHFSYGRDADGSACSEKGRVLRTGHQGTPAHMCSFCGKA